MRIAYLCAHYLTYRGGAEVHVHRLAEELARRGHDLTIFAAAGPLAPFPDAPYRVVPLARDTRCEQRVRRLLGLESRRGGYRLAQWLFRSGYHRLLALGPCCPELTQPGLYEGYDVVALIHGGNAWSVLAARAMPRVRTALRVAVPLLHVREDSAAWPVLPKLYRPYDLVITNSAYEAAWMAARGWGAQRIHPVGVGSDAYPRPVAPGAFRAAHGIPAGAPLVVFVGRKVFNKGVLHLVQAMGPVWQREPEARLALLGFSHNPPSWIRDAVAALGPPAEGRVVDLDDASEQVREEALCDADVFCMPSISDSFGIAYLDAWRHAKPVVGCLRTSSESIIGHEQDGLLVEFGDVPGLGAALLRLLGDEALRLRLGRAGHAKWSSMYQWEIIARRTEELFATARRDRQP